MFSKLREILLTQYIGSILIALLALQAAVEFVTRAVRTGFWIFNNRHSDSVLGGSSDAPFPWDNLIFSAVTFALYLLTAYALARWLYPAAVPITQVATDDESPPHQPEQS